jgi:hypothetical protein
MTFDDRLRDELQRAVESHPLDTEAALQGVKHTHATPASPVPADAVVVALEDADVPRRTHLRTQRIIGVAAAITLIAGAVAVPLALRGQSHDTARRKTRIVNDKHGKKGSNSSKLVNTPQALQAVASAVAATTGAGSFQVAYTLAETPATVPTTTTCQRIDVRTGIVGVLGATATPGPTGQGDVQIPPAQPQTPVTECYPSGTNNNVTTTGIATVNVNPFAMVAVSNVSSFGAVTVQVDDTNYWETTGSGTASASSPGSPISSFASLVESTLGPREGASAMMGLASPTGYLSITRAAITGAAKIGTGTVNGEPVTNYRVTVDPTLLANVPGLSAEEKTTIDAALQVMRAQGFTGNSTDVSVDANGFVVHTASTDKYADGGTVYSEDTFSQFGCAGAVQIPGRASDTTPSACADVPTSTTLPDTSTSAASPVTSVNPGIVSGAGPTGGSGPAASHAPLSGVSGSDGGVAGPTTTVSGSPQAPLTSSP